MESTNGLTATGNLPTSTSSSGFQGGGVEHGPLSRAVEDLMDSLQLPFTLTTPFGLPSLSGSFPPPSDPTDHQSRHTQQQQHQHLPTKKTTWLTTEEQIPVAWAKSVCKLRRRGNRDQRREIKRAKLQQKTGTTHWGEMKPNPWLLPVPACTQSRWRPRR